MTIMATYHAWSNVVYLSHTMVYYQVW